MSKEKKNLMILGIIQARTGSSRLPGKIMMKIEGKTMLEHMIERISKSKKLDKIIIATTTKKNDDVITILAKKMNIDIFRGSENDVLDRYYNACEKYSANIVVRLSSDSPLLDGEIIDNVIEEYLSGNYDFVGTLAPQPRTFPDGLSVEVFSSKLLNYAQLNAKKLSDREHVTLYMLTQPHKFKIHRVDYENDCSRYRFNLDYSEDFQLLKKIFKNFYPKNKHFKVNDVIQWLENNPRIFEINNMSKSD